MTPHHATRSIASASHDSAPSASAPRASAPRRLRGCTGVERWPLGRSGHSATALPELTLAARPGAACAVDECMLVLGGILPCNQSGAVLAAFTNDAYLLAAHTSLWRMLRAEGVAPTPRALHSATLLSTGSGGIAPPLRVCVYGGWGSGSCEVTELLRCGPRYLGDVHVLSIHPTTGHSHWAQLRLPGPAPAPRAAAAALPLPSGGVIFFGGRDEDGYAPAVV